MSEIGQHDLRLPDRTLSADKFGDILSSQSGGTSFDPGLGVDFGLEKDTGI